MTFGWLAFFYQHFVPTGRWPYGSLGTCEQGNRVGAIAQEKITQKEVATMIETSKHTFTGVRTMHQKPLTMLLAAVVFLPTVAVAQQADRNAPRRPQVHLGTRANGTLDLNHLWSRGRAEGKGPVRFTHSPMRLEDVERITQMGLMVGGHVCPIDCGYCYPKPLKPYQPHVDVYSPTDGFIVMASHRTQLSVRS